MSVLDSGFDLLSGTLGAYFQYEDHKAGNELADAQLQQTRLETAISVEQQINERANDAREAEAMTNRNYVLMGVGGLVAVILVMKLAGK